MGVGPEILVSFALLTPHHQSSRPFVGSGEGQVGVGLVVDELDVESGSMLFDQPVLEHQRRNLRFSEDPLNRSGVVDHCLSAWVETRAEV